MTAKMVYACNLCKLAIDEERRKGTGMHVRADIMNVTSDITFCRMDDTDAHVCEPCMFALIRLFDDQRLPKEAS